MFKIRFYKILVIILFTVNIIYAQSSYEEPIHIPPYDATNPDMYLIQSDSDWSHINDPNIHYFYVAPGDYSNAGVWQNDYKILITQSGTPTQKRFISLYNDNDLHPGKLNRNQLAKVGFILRNADYWVIDRMSYWEQTDGRIPVILEASSYNIINRYFAENVNGGMIYLYSYSNNNIVQNCRVQRNDINLNMDRAAIALQGDDNEPVINNKIINNEIYNAVDGFQAVTDKDLHPEHFFDYQGTIVDHNIFYIDNSIYTDCNGNPDSNGDCAYAENAIDIKSGSENPNNPFIITHNKMWGFRSSDTTNCDLNDVGSAMVVHYNVKNLIISDNLIFNSDRAITVGGRANGPAWQDSEFSNNIMYQTYDIAIKLYDSDNITFENNLLKEVSLDAVWKNTAFIDCNNISVQHDLRVNTYDTEGVRVDNSTVTPSNNGYYNSLPDDMQDATDIIYTTDPTDTYSDFIFETDRFTNQPFTINIPKIITTVSIKDYKNQTKLIYPNPTNDIINISLANDCNFDIFIFDISGKLIFNSRLVSHQNIIDMSNFLPGYYFVKIKKDTDEKIFKVLKTL